MSRSSAGGWTVAKATVALCVALVARPAHPHAGADAVEPDATALMELGRLQYAQREFASAQVSFSRAVEQIERAHDPLASELIEPLVALGDAQVGAGRFEQASQSFARAVSIVRREGGVNDARQLVPLEKMADAQAFSGQMQAAAGSLKYFERVSEATYGAQSRPFGEKLTRVADRLCQFGFYFDGRSRHRRALGILDGADTAEIDALRSTARCNLYEISAFAIVTPAQLPEQLRGVAGRPQHFNADSTSFRTNVVRLMRYESEQALTRAARLALASETMPASEKVQVLLEAGDWFQMRDHVRTARGYYEQVLLLMRTGDDARTTLLSSPVMLMYAPPPLSLLNEFERSEATTRRFVVAQFEVRADGRVQSERVIARDATKTMVDETLSALRAARYRPRFVNGKPEDTLKVTYRQIFLQ
ncbi:tetratricopeptide (TPR) repeat protein [Povalibacter uvarum]|uniref:Tetratricopeptide (TPR) repeat protein n=1 Tax=Povalibacter uvarum TaxID=732238 RepID=A0A841HG61_9GAMM|nr:tetratricopeptide repeat protein [Povalibacter uvarum]MBB6091756.1 tetratricopeptide (TPR) repeat protein [Povalibacter uvarum]